MSDRPQTTFRPGDRVQAIVRDQTDTPVWVVERVDVVEGFPVAVIAGVGVWRLDCLRKASANAN